MRTIQQSLYFGNVVLDKDRNRKVAEYGRVSTQHEAQIDALGNQMQWYEEQRRYHPNWEVVGQYIDEGITGTLAKKRPAFMRMIEDARNGKFDLIVTREVCRFARNTVDTLMLTRELKNYGVEVYFVSDNIWTMDGDGEMRLSIMATMAQEESRKISERVRAGQMVSRQNGVLYGNGNIIGYDLDKTNNTYIINPEQAETIRTIFNLYAEGKGEKMIVNELCRLGCKDGHGNVSWSCIKVSRILRNATYMGYIGYNKSVTNNYLEKKRIKNLEDDTFIYVKGDFEPIISEEQWRLCEQIRKNRIAVRKMPNGEERRIGTQKGKSLWSQKLKCRCGATYSRYKWRVLADGTPVYGYQCHRRTVNPTRTFVMENNLTDQLSCDAISIPEWKLDLMATMIFKQVWGNQRKAVLRACEIVVAVQKNAKTTFSFECSELHRRIEKAEAAKLNLSRMFAYGEISAEEYRVLKAQAESDIVELKAKLEVQPELAQPPSIEPIKRVLEQVVDVSGPKVSEALIERFVEAVTPAEDFLFRWKLNLGKRIIGTDNVDLITGTDKPVLDFWITFDVAKKYRQANKMPTQFRSNAWSDLRVQVYI